MESIERGQAADFRRGSSFVAIFTRGVSLLMRAWVSLRSGFWFRPIAVAVLIGLTSPMVTLWERGRDSRIVELGFGNDPATARAILTTLVGSLITVLGVTLTVTIVTAQLVSSQFSPRSIRGVLAKPTPQLIVGVVVGAILYGLLTVRAVSRSAPFVPSLSVVITMALGIVSLLAIVYFVHYTSRIFQVENIAAEIYENTRHTIDRVAEEPHRAVGAGDKPIREPSTTVAIAAGCSGYVQQIELSELDRWARDHDVRLFVGIRTGDFVTPESVLARVDGTLRDRCDEVRSKFVIEAQRDLLQDPAFGLDQLSDIAVRALSPGVNDSSTAVTCIHYWGALLERLAGRWLPASKSVGTHDRVVFRCMTFEELLEGRAGEIAQFARPIPRVFAVFAAELQRIARAAESAGANERADTILAVARWRPDEGPRSSEAARTI
jgi:uncharacterized membrane protein